MEVWRSETMEGANLVVMAGMADSPEAEVRMRVFEAVEKKAFRWGKTLEFGEEEGDVG
jgi:hypothetical protein